MFKSIAALLLISPLLIACSPPPEITASSREDAMKKCFAGINEELAEMRADPDQDLFDSDEFRRVTILQKYCKPYESPKHSGYWTVRGYVEYLTEPTAKYPGRSEVQDVLIHYGYTWKE